MSPNMQYLSQRDIRWKDERLGASVLTVGKYGCTTTGISMLTDYFGCFVSPKDIARNRHNYTRSGLILWGDLDFKNMKFVWRDYKEDKTRIADACKQKNKAVLLTVDGDSHWVVAVRPIEGGDYIIIDTWDGKKKNLKSAYKKVTGAAFFERK